MEQVLSIEEKARRYDEAIINASRLWESDIISRESYEYIFPALKESEDERIRKRLIDFFKDFGKTKSHCWNVSVRKILAWLEKQGEQKSLDDVAKEIAKNKETAISFLKSCGIMNANGELADEYKIEQGKQKSVDNVEPRFHEGDWITDNTSTFQIVRVENEWYYADDGDKICFDVAHQYYHLWTIDDAKDGDILVHNGCTFIFMGIKDGIVQAIDEIMLEPVSFGEPDKDNDYHPATEEQCDQLEKALAGAGYEWDSKKKELKKIESKFHVGDWVVDEVTGSVYQIKDCIENICNNKYGYDLTNGGYIGSGAANHFHLWTIKDAEDGDVLAIEPIDGYQFPFIAVYENRGLDSFGLDSFNSYCFIGFDGKFYEGEAGHALDDIHPATKEQRELLFSKMKEAGYELKLNANKKRIGEGCCSYFQYW